MDQINIGDGQMKMEAHIKAQIDMYLTQQANSINGMMQPEFVECSYEEKTLTIAFPVLEWEKNRVGALHGGVIAAAFDIATGLLARYLSGESFSPTIQLETVFIRPIMLGDVFEVVVKINLAGRKLTHMYCEGFVKSTGKLAATSTASYLNENTNERPASE
jgi:acyl-coenzyme A thioesterase PaaI-like protein